MPTELEELVGFIANPSPQIRQIALANLVPYSTTDPSIFKAQQLQPIKDLGVLIQDHPNISEHAVTILVNLSGDREVLETLAANDKFLRFVFARIVDPEEPNANLFAMLLANLAKWDGFASVLHTKQPAPERLGSDDTVLNQLMDLFVKGQDGAHNPRADFDYLAYVFADLAKHADIRRYFAAGPQGYDAVVPLSKLKVFTEHPSAVRRKGVASTLKNVAFDVPNHPALLAADDLNLLPYLLLPIVGGEEYDPEETMAMLPDLQLLPPDKQRDPDPAVIQTHVETLMLLTTTREGRELMRDVKVYPIIRETHSRVENEGVKEACDRLVQVLMRDEEPEGAVQEAGGQVDARVHEIADDEDQIVEV